MAINNVQFGAESSLTHQSLPAVQVPNSAVLTKQPVKYFNDMLALFMKDKFIAGPFDSQLLLDTTLKSVFVVEHPENFRPILNMSKPDNESFNSAFKILKTLKVSMSNQKLVAMQVFRCDINTILS